MCPAQSKKSIAVSRRRWDGLWISTVLAVVVSASGYPPPTVMLFTKLQSIVRHGWRIKGVGVFHYSLFGSFTNTSTRAV